MNTQENNIPTLAELLDKFDNGEIPDEFTAYQYYLTEENKVKNKISWIHNTELKGQSLLRGMSKASARRDLLRNTSY
jgi:hypothetical protein